MRTGEVATYLHPETAAGSRPLEAVAFFGHSVPHFAQVRAALAGRLGAYPQLPLRQAVLADYRAVHTPEYLVKVAALAAGERPKSPPKLSPECRGLPYFLPAYLYGLGGLCEAIDQMAAGRVSRAYCFSLVGHHAFPDWGHGYCLLNPLAAAVRYAQRRGFTRVAIVDWDIHHGDGTQAIFAHDPTVYCVSIHSALDPYMAKVSDWRAGMPAEGRRVGHCNLPVAHALLAEARPRLFQGCGPVLLAGEVLPAFREALQALPFRPDLVCVFSGYDGHKGDCGRRVTDWDNNTFAALTRTVLAVARESGCPVLSVHGGGYKLAVTVEAAICHVETLADHVGPEA